MIGGKVRHGSLVDFVMPTNKAKGCSIVNSLSVAATPTIVAFDFGEARLVLARVVSEGRVADRIVPNKLALAHRYQPGINNPRTFGG